MKSSRLILILSLSLIITLLSSCIKNRFVVEFDLDTDVSVNCRMIYYAYSKKQGLVIENNLPLQAGKGSAECAMLYPTVVSLTVSDTSQPLYFWAERGDKIIISGSGKEPIEWNVKGNDINQRWSAWRKENMKELKSGDRASINGCVKKYVENNPKDELSALLLLCQYYRSENPEQWSKLWNMLNEKCKKREIIQATGNSDLAEMPENEYSRKISDMIVRSARTGCDTLRFSKSKSSFIYLRTTDESENHTSLDSLKILRRNYPDSAKYLIADLCLDSDSLMWNSSLSRDTLNGVVRGWIPAGPADKNIMALDAGATPWYVVAHANNIVYSGNDLIKALNAFKNKVKK